MQCSPSTPKAPRTSLRGFSFVHASRSLPFPSRAACTSCIALFSCTSRFCSNLTCVSLLKTKNITRSLNLLGANLLHAFISAPPAHCISPIHASANSCAPLRCYNKGERTHRPVPVPVSPCSNKLYSFGISLWMRFRLSPQILLFWMYLSARCSNRC